MKSFVVALVTPDRGQLKEIAKVLLPIDIYILHCKNYSNVHFKSQNYSCVLDSHTCLGDRISCCRKISGDKSKIKAVILMEIIKTTESRSQIYTGIFLSLSL